jgi:hypothetical protein
MDPAAAGGCEVGRAPGVDRSHPAHAAPPGSSQVAPRHPRTIAYRCFLPDLTGFAGLRCVGPDFRRRAMKWEAEVIDLGREFSPAVADCGCRAPLVPRLARPVADGRPGGRTGQRRRRVGGGEGGIRTPDGFPRTAFPVRRHRPLGDLSGTVSERTGEWRRGWDSNPRCSSHTAFRERHLKPLGHLSPGRRVYQWARWGGNRVGHTLRPMRAFPPPDVAPLPLARRR